jgi:dolichyl-phosphate beta-glucosyltransferase
LDYSKRHTTDKVRVLTLDKNRGKGGAIRMGVIRSRGKKILFADADGASKFSDYNKLEGKLDECAKGELFSEIVVCGSRRHLEKDSVAKRSLFRTFLMYGFHSIVWLLCVKGIRDTQCGFKLFTRDAAIKCFANLHIERWAFDVDLLCIASYLNMKIFEVDVNWQEKDGSKVTPASWIQMGKDILSIRLHYLFGAWKIDENLKLE